MKQRLFMRKNVWLICLGLVCCNLISAQWSPAGNKIKTSWGEKLDPKNVLQNILARLWNVRSGRI